MKSKPCPFCGERSFQIEEHRSRNLTGEIDFGESYFVRCRECNCEGPMADNWQLAVDRWNNRISFWRVRR